VNLEFDGEPTSALESSVCRAAGEVIRFPFSVLTSFLPYFVLKGNHWFSASAIRMRNHPILRLCFRPLIDGDELCVLRTHMCTPPTAPVSDGFFAPLAAIRRQNCGSLRSGGRSTAGNSCRLVGDLVFVEAEKAIDPRNHFTHMLHNDVNPIPFR
jgi:hypothetical protein